MKKFTKASLKAWIKKNKDSLYIRVDSSFDGMTDCIELSENKALTKIDHNSINFTKRNDWGIPGFWIVESTGRGGDRFEKKENKVKVSNCCGSFTLVSI